MDTQDLVSLGVDQKFDKSIIIKHCDGPAVGLEREHALLLTDAILLQLLLGPADTGDLGLGLDDSRDDVVVNVPVSCGYEVHCGNTVFLCLMRQHWALDAVPNCLNVIDVCFHQ